LSEDAQKNETNQDTIDYFVDDSFFESDTLRVSIADAIAGIICIAYILCMLLICAIRKVPEFGFVFWYPSIILYPFGILLAFFPKIFWAWVKWRYSSIVKCSGKTEPTESFLVWRKIGAWAVVLVGWIFIALAYSYSSVK
jgi:hypothetical protein